MSAGCARWAAIALLCLAASSIAAVAPPVVAPEEHRRGADQTFLTFPEWFLVHSPVEYAAFVKEHDPSEFPFLAHVCQFWQSYRAVYEATRDEYPFNPGYHVMISVIGTSTTAEYGLRSAYETIVGRLTALSRRRGETEEDRYGARVAQDYVDFIRVQPWYEFDFLGKLEGLWQETTLGGPDMLRKWERKYALTTEYAIKAVYGWLIKKTTKASYDEPLPVTAVVIDRVPARIESELPDLKIVRRNANGSALVTVPRYHAFTRYSTVLAQRGASFREIAGNRSVILVSALVPSGWKPDSPQAKILFTQPIITQPGRERVALVVPVESLSANLVRLTQPGIELEHVYDY